jgi:hypothetical protein
MRRAIPSESSGQVINCPMSDNSDATARPEPAPTPETTDFLLTTFADLYRQEVAAEEDVHRTLPFFGTALGIVIAALAYAAGRLPKWCDLVAVGHGRIAFCVSTVLIGLSITEAVFVLVFVSRAIARRAYQRIGPEPALRTRMYELRAYYEGQGVDEVTQDKEMAKDMRVVLLDSYTEVTSSNRILNQRRYRFRALASSHLVRSLIWALVATSVMFVTDKLGYLPKANP